MKLLIFISFVFVTALISIFAIHRFFQVLVVFFCGESKLTPLEEPDEWPEVTIQIPVYNEKHVIESLLESTIDIDYPNEKLLIQILDDSNDETAKIIDDFHKKNKERLRIQIIRRSERAGFKAGALKNGLTQTNSPFVAIFDADFIIPKDFLKKTMPRFLSDSRLGVIQTKWSFLNLNANILTQSLAKMLEAHFHIEHLSKQNLGCLIHFNGTAGIWRMEAIKTSGNWSFDTITEDLDLSYRAQLNDWKIIYEPKIKCPSEIPQNISSIKTQQYRWAKGAVQVCRKILPKIIQDSKLTLLQKLEAIFHLISPISHVLLLLLVLLVGPFYTYIPYDQLRHLLGSCLLISSLLVMIYFLVPGYREKALSVFDLVRAFWAMLLGIGLSAHNSIAAISGIFHSRGVFDRTPKVGKTDQSDYLELVKRGLFVEIAIIIYLLSWLQLFMSQGYYLVGIPICLFVLGYAMILFEFIKDLKSKARITSGNSMNIEGHNLGSQTPKEIYLGTTSYDRTLK